METESANLYVKKHIKKFFVINLRHKGKNDRLYIIGSDLNWQKIIIVEAYSLHWPIEFFFEYFKQHKGGDRLTGHTLEKKTILYLSLLFLSVRNFVKLKGRVKKKVST